LIYDSRNFAPVLPELRKQFEQTPRAARQPGAQGGTASLGPIVLFCQLHDLGLNFNKLLQLVNL
jgi:hypothetical protein